MTSRRIDATEAVLHWADVEGKRKMTWSGGEAGWGAQRAVPRAPRVRIRLPCLDASASCCPGRSRASSEA